jgi:hypothetical protein
MKENNSLKFPLYAAGATQGFVATQIQYTGSSEDTGERRIMMKMMATKVIFEG